MITPDGVVRIYQFLESHGIQVWLTGGWGIDALLGENTRFHKDLDILMLVDDVVCLSQLMVEQGYELKELWSENLSTIDSRGNLIQTAFVLRDQDGRELDVHALRLDPQGKGIPAWAVKEGFVFKPHDLSGMGIVSGCAVRCQSADNQMACHIGYRLPDYQWDDLDKLHEKCGVEIPAEITSQRTNNPFELR